ncbi:MAG: hypothetical protein DWG76_07840 [Chloroflexi bacterium]|nr:hypothetical protein [Chloroflexota bacterium]MQC27338.1 hypothetical protein [Chloroflexota bacterium]
MKKTEEVSSNQLSAGWAAIANQWLLPDTPSERQHIFDKFGDNPDHQYITYLTQLIHFTYLVFNGNAVAYKNQALEIRNTGLTLSSPNFNEKYWWSVVKLTRCLLNFLGSMTILIDVLRNIIDCEISDKVFKDDYSREVNSLFGDLPEASFFKKLRNYSVHRKLPLAGPAVSGNMPIEIYLETKELKAWGKIGNATKQFIEKIEVQMIEGGDFGIIVDPLVGRYRDRQELLNIWMMKKIINFNPDIVQQKQ